VVILQIEHSVASFIGWKLAFDSDPIDRKGSGVRRHRVLRPIDDANYTLAELEFDGVAEAEAYLTSLRGLWSRVEGAIMTSPRARIVELVESKEY
jgi:hypothetical protein